MATAAEYTKPWKDRIEALIARVQAGVGAALAQLAILGNRVQQELPSGAIVGAGGAIAPVAALTTKGPNGKIRVSATFSGALAAGTLTAFLTVQVGAGPVNHIVNWAVATGPKDVSEATVFELTTGAPPGTVITVSMNTTAGDAALTLGNAASPVPTASSLLIEEVL